jgi:transposase
MTQPVASQNGAYVRKVGITDIQSEPDSSKQELKLEFVALRAKGWSYARIAKKLRVAKGTLANWNQELEEEIASLKAMELEALQETYFLAKEARIRLLGEQVKAIQKEIKSRDLTTVPTEKLLELQLRYYAELREEYIEPRPLASSEIAELKALRLEVG